MEGALIAFQLANVSLALLFNVEIGHKIVLKMGIKCSPKQLLHSKPLCLNGPFRNYKSILDGIYRTSI